MHKVYYDLHIHTALSPCADNDMVPCDIVGMAYLNGLDVIAVTDHNSFANARAVIDAAFDVRTAQKLDKNLLVLPGIEITTAEEVHVLALFDCIDTALAFESELSVHYSTLKNRDHIFGQQLMLNADDSIAGKMDRMLIAPSAITFDNLFMLVREYSGAFVPAHIDRSSFSVISNLGFLPPHLDIAALEFSPEGVLKNNNESGYTPYPDKKILISSDSHQLHTISGRNNFILLPEFSASAIIDYLRFPLK